MIECRDCEIEFDPDAVPHKDLGFRNQCFDCAEEAGCEDVRVKAFINITEEGDFGSISVVPKKFFDKVKKMEELYKDE